MLVDTHAHLAFPNFDPDREEVIHQAQEAGVSRIICVSASLEEAAKACQIAASYPQVWASVGLHPQEVRPKESQGMSLDQQLAELETLAHHSRVVAIGETGFDFSPPPPGERARNFEEQDCLFRAQIKLAQKLKLPVIIHSRQARAETLKLLKEAGPPNGVVHCFSEEWEFAQAILDLGLLISFTGIVTYPKAEPVQDVARRLPLEQMMLETDCPFLAPQPVRGQRNEPKYVKMIAEKVAELQGKSLEAVASATTKSCQQLFWPV